MWCDPTSEGRSVLNISQIVEPSLLEGCVLTYEIDVACFELLQAVLNADEHGLGIVAGVVAVDSLWVSA